SLGGLIVHHAPDAPRALPYLGPHADLTGLREGGPLGPALAMHARHLYNHAGIVIEPVRDVRVGVPLDRYHLLNAAASAMWSPWPVVSLGSKIFRVGIPILVHMSITPG